MRKIPTILAPGRVLPPVGDDRPFLRASPCECGELPMLIEGVYVCTCPACPSYDGPAWDGMEEMLPAS